jgi:outer membrane protein assembly factor BamB
VITTACEIMCLDVNGMADGNDGPFKDEGQYMAGPTNPPLTVATDDADIIWVCDLIDQLGVCPHDVASCSILIDGPFLYTTTSNGVDEPHNKCLRPDAPSYVVFDAATGRLLAKDTEDLGHKMWHCVWSPPSMGIVNGKKLVFFGGGDGWCYAFEALTEVPGKTVDLKKVWQYDCNPPHYRLRDGKPIPYYEGDKRKKYTTNKNDGLYLGPSQIISTPVFHDGRVYVTIGQDPEHGRGKGLLHCIDASKTGDVTKAGCVWTYEAIERSIGSVAISNGLLYVADLPGRVHCLDVATGKPVWVHELKAETWSTPLVADGKVFVGTKKEFVIMAEGKEEKELAKINLGAPAYGTPIAVNGTLFVASQKYLWAVEKGAKPVAVGSDSKKN